MELHPQRYLAACAVTLLLAAVSACTFMAPGLSPPGTSIDDVRRSGRTPTGEYELAGGGRRLEFAQGSFGRETYMMDFDAKGTLLSSQQVLTRENLATIVPGILAQEVRMRFGRPANVMRVPRQHLEVWNYRFAGADCEWFQVSVSDAGPVTEAGLGWDPACDGPNTRE